MKQEILMKSKAKFKFNGGNPVLLCSKCSAVIKYSKYFTEDEWAASKGDKKIPAQYCDECELKLKKFD